MSDLVSFGRSVVPACLYAAAIQPLLTLPGWQGAIVSTCAASVLLLMPLLTPADEFVIRGLAAFLCLELALKAIDYAREQRRGLSSGFGSYFDFMLPFPMLLVRFSEKQRRLPQWPNWSQLPPIVLWGVLLLLPFLAVAGLADVQVAQNHFLVDHALKMGLFAVVLEVGSRYLLALERFAGYDTSPVIQNIVLSRTPGEFWWRYNTRVHSWLQANVFEASGGRRSPIRGVILVFFVSAVLHEVLFDLATSRVDGYQFTFFMLQAPAVLLSRGLERFAVRHGVVGDLIVRALTITWFYVTSMFFFRGVERIFPLLYASEPLLP